MKRMTQKQEVLRYLKYHKSISTVEATVKLFIADLQSIIRHLKKEHNISWKWIYKTNMYGRPVRFKRYRLSSVWDKVEGYTPYRRVQ